MSTDRKVAIFDVDGTIFRSSLLIELVEIMIEYGLFQESVRADYERERLHWLERKGDYEAYIQAIIKVFVANIKGVSYKEFDDACTEVVARHKDKNYRFTRDLIKDLKKKGYYLLAISQSPKTILDKFCIPLGFDKVYGRIYETGPSDKLTGAVTDEHLISNKANIVRRAVLKENLTLENSVGVGDTESDIPFLEMVAKPICFNPNSMLWKQAKRSKWRVVVERKDVVYEI
ncbi:MAG: HAD-IB family hydrolase [Candidatus Pacebacteria bacterium]|nr:HAD-IB family hydrolase [Candidatus Paceibacterota bacterium]